MEQRIALFPLRTHVERTGKGDHSFSEHLFVGDVDLIDLAEAYGTPLYFFDEATLDDAVAQYRSALAKWYPGEGSVTLAGKALLFTASAQWAQARGLRLDCTGAGEIAIARRAGVPADRILVHGVNKSDADLDAALGDSGILVVDNLAELERVLARIGDFPTPPDLWVRVRPGIAVETHAYRQTGQPDSKFGMDGNEARHALQLAQAAGVAITGVHFHQGSHFHDVAPVGPGLAAVLDLIAQLRDETGWTPTHLSPGGGWGVPYHEEDLPHPAIEEYVRFVSEALTVGCAARGLPLPVLHLEPGRSLVAKAGVAIYRVGAVKESGGRHWLLIDGGMADNPRPALYGARYSALPLLDPLRTPVAEYSFGGPYCESGDVLIKDLAMPALAQGEYVAIPVSGAYHINMQSNYNGARKPAVVWLRDGEAIPVQRRERVEDLVARDLAIAF